MFTQIYWVRKAFTLEEQQFEQGVNAALFNVAKKLSDYNQTVMPTLNPVKQLSSNYFIVNVNDVIDANVLEHFLQVELGKRNIKADFEYGIYDCTTDQMVYGDYITFKDRIKKPENKNLLKYDEYDYYFGVRFPQRASFITSRMEIWVFSTLILAVVIVFFASTIFIILRQKRLSEVQKDFINNMTHEFKTPISTIGISADVLLQKNAIDKPERLQKYAAIIKSEANRLNLQVLRVLQMAKMDKEKQKLELKEVDLESLLADIINSLKQKAEARGGSIFLQAEAKPIIRADEVHLANILNNLLENAMHYSKHSPQITVKIFESAGNVVVVINDNGIGIAKEHQKKVFDKFYRVPKGNVHDVKGFGIGLHYVKNMVRAHGWKIRLESILNKGSTFTISIPKHEH